MRQKKNTLEKRNLHRQLAWPGRIQSILFVDMKAEKTLQLMLLNENIRDTLGLVQTSIFTCTEPNCNLGRLE